MTTLADIHDDVLVTIRETEPLAVRPFQPANRLKLFFGRSKPPTGLLVGHSHEVSLAVIEVQGRNRQGLQKSVVKLVTGHGAVVLDRAGTVGPVKQGRVELLFLADPATFATIKAEAPLTWPKDFTEVYVIPCRQPVVISLKVRSVKKIELDLYDVLEFLGLDIVRWIDGRHLRIVADNTAALSIEQIRSHLRPLIKAHRAKLAVHKGCAILG
jgi:hypothetical protein